MKKIISILLTAGVMISSFTATGCAENMVTDGEKVIVLTVGDPMMRVNGESKEIDPGEGTAPVISNERTMLPVRAIVEELGGKAEWNGELRRVTLNHGDNEMILEIGSTEAYFNGEKQTIDTAPEIINDRTMLPIRFIAESFGFKVEWEQDSQTVTVSGAAATDKTGTEETVSDSEQEESRMLVAYFSATGNTEKLAESIAEITGADIYEIVPAEPYTAEDLDYSNDSCRANTEMNDESARPEIAGKIEDIDEYDTIILGYPIWWGTMPRIINTFLDTYDLSGKTIMPFCTSGGSGVTGSVSDIKEYCSDANVTEGLSGSASTDEEQIQEWIQSQE